MLRCRGCNAPLDSAVTTARRLCWACFNAGVAEAPPLVVIESPFAGGPTTARKDDVYGTAHAVCIDHTHYVRACMRDSLLRGEAPMASHALYTLPGVLDDTDPSERDRGIQAGFAWREVAHITAVYTDLGISPGMHQGINNSKELEIPIVYRTLSVHVLHTLAELSG